MFTKKQAFVKKIFLRDKSELDDFSGAITHKKMNICLVSSTKFLFYSLKKPHAKFGAFVQLVKSLLFIYIERLDYMIVLHGVLF